MVCACGGVCSLLIENPLKKAQKEKKKCSVDTGPKALALNRVTVDDFRHVALITEGCGRQVHSVKVCILEARER